MSELCTHCTLCMCGYAVCVHIHVDDSWTWLCVCRWDSQHDMRIYHMNGCEYRKKTTHTLCRWVLCWYGGFCHTSLEILKPFGDCKRGNLSICTLHKHQVLYLLYYMAEVSRNCSQTKWAKKTKKKNPSPNQSSSLNVANSKCSQHNLAHQWRAVESDGVEVSWRKGIYSILIVGGGRVAGEAFQHFQFYLRVERGCWFCSFSRTKLPWRQQRPKAEEIYECWKRKNRVGAAEHYLEYRFAWQVHKTSICPDDVCRETLARDAVYYSLSAFD